MRLHFPLSLSLSLRNCISLTTTSTTLFSSDKGSLINLLLRSQGLSGQFHMGNCVVKNHTDDDSDNHVEFSGGNVHLITTKESWDEKLGEAGRDGKIVIANFSATWCGPCRVVAPFYIELSERYPSLMFLLVDVDELSELSSSWDIKATPTFFILKNGEQMGKLVGANKAELEKKITGMVDSMAPPPSQPQ